MDRGRFEMLSHPLLAPFEQKEMGLDEWESEKQRIVDERNSYYEKAVRLSEMVERVLWAACFLLSFGFQSHRTWGGINWRVLNFDFSSPCTDRHGRLSGMNLHG